MNKILKVLLRRNKKRPPSALTDDVKFADYLLSCFTDKK